MTVDARTTFRPQLWGRLLAAVALILWPLVTVEVLHTLAGRNVPIGRVVVVLLVLIAAAVPPVLALTSRLILEPDAVHYRNFVRKHRMPLDRVDRCEATSLGIRFVESTGRYRVAIAVQRSNLAAALGLNTRSDRLCETINSRIRERRHGTAYERRKDE